VILKQQQKPNEDTHQFTHQFKPARHIISSSSIKS